MAFRSNHRILILAVAAALFALMLFSAGAATERARHGGFDEIIAQNDTSSGQPSPAESEAPEPEAVYYPMKLVLNNEPNADYAIRSDVL